VEDKGKGRNPINEGADYRKGQDFYCSLKDPQDTMREFKVVVLGSGGVGELTVTECFDGSSY